MSATISFARHSSGDLGSPVAAWAQSGLMALSGEADGAPMVPAFDAMRGIASLFDALAEAAAFTGRTLPADLRLLTERAALMGLRRGGSISCNRSCRLIEARDGWIAVNLCRESDLSAVPAWIGAEEGAEPWAEIAEAARVMNKADLVEKGQLLGLAVAEVPASLPLGAQLTSVPWSVQRIGAGAAAEPRDWRGDPPLVVDLSALWAGPLCGSLLAALGARVIKVESIGRPDSVRSSCPAFFDLLNGGKQSVVLDFDGKAGRAALAALVARADVVISSARPRAFAQLGLPPEVVAAKNPALTWVAITAHGWTGPNGNAIGFGDDAAAAAGLVVWTKDGTPMFAGDAIADPLTGIAAAAGALHGIRSGGGVLIDASLRSSASHVVSAGACNEHLSCRPICIDGAWYVDTGNVKVRVAEPRARATSSRAAPFGADTADVLQEFV